MIKSNLPNYRTPHVDRSRMEDSFQLFLAHILTVDFEKKVCTLREDKSDLVYTDVRLMPAMYSGAASTDMVMPEENTTCLCCKVAYQGGYSTVAIVNYMAADFVSSVDAIAHRPLDGIEGWRERVRASYRKAYPGQHASAYTGGFSEKTDEGWDKIAKDFSRDRLDADRRERTEITSRQVTYTDAGFKMEGPINRPGANNIPKEQLPDGSTRQILYLNPNQLPTARYFNSAADIIPWSEKTEKIQEFSLDYALPQELFQTSIMDFVLGTTQLPWTETKVAISAGGDIFTDDETYLASQPWDHPYSLTTAAVGPALQEGQTPRRRGWIIEKSEGTLVGSNLFDPTTYGLILKPVIFLYNQIGRFSADAEASYLAVTDDPSHVEARCAASAYSLRFPNEINNTRLDITKEGFTTFSIGSTLPKEVNPYNTGSYQYEHPHGAGRSLEGNLVGSLKLVVGKNRDEEDSVDLTTLGQTVWRLGADDTSAPNARHDTLYQERKSNDKIVPMTYQYWSSPKAGPGDAVNLQNKQGMENISLRMAADGGAVMRFGARNPASLRRHIINGYQDGPGLQQYAVGSSSRVDSKSPGRPTYGSGDANYRFHDLTQAGAPNPALAYPPYNWSGPATSNMDAQGLSVDFHAVRDVLLRIGADETNNLSLLMDLAGGIAAWIGKDTKGRSITATLDGGVEMVIGPNAQQKGLRLQINGDVDWTIKGNFHMNVTGDTVWNSTTHRHNVMTDSITTAQNIVHKALAQATVEATSITTNEGLSASGENQ